MSDLYRRLTLVTLYIFLYYTPHYEERSGSVVESLTRDQGVIGLSLTVDNVLCR